MIYVLDIILVLSFMWYVSFLEVVCVCFCLDLCMYDYVVSNLGSTWNFLSFVCLLVSVLFNFVYWVSIFGLIVIYVLKFICFMVRY